VSEFTNILNVFRFQDIDFYMPAKVKFGIHKRALAIFSEEQYKAEMEQLTFEQVCKILSDLVHSGYIIPIANRVNQMLDKKEGLKNVNTLVRLLDAFFVSKEDGMEQADLLVKKLENVLREKETFALLTPSQMVRLMRSFSYASYINITKFSILDRLTYQLESKIN
jgi:hypothetical protein